MRQSLLKTIILPIAIICLNNVVNADKCDRVRIGEEFYKRQLLANIDGYATGIAVDPKTESLFFLLNKRNYTKGIHLLKHGSLGVKDLPITDELHGQCVAVDAINNVIYIGTNQGILTYDYSRPVINAERPIGDDDVRNIFIDRTDNQMYLTTGPNYEIFKYLNQSAAVKRFERVPKAFKFVQDSKGNVIYEYTDGKLYFYSNDLYEPVQYKGFSRELKYIIQVNNNDEVIVAVKGSLFKLTTDNILPKKIANLGFKITGMAFDGKNQLIVGSKGKLYRYKPIHNNDPCSVDDYFFAQI